MIKSTYITAATSEGLHIQVEVFPSLKHTNELIKRYVFAYKITITNTNHYTVKLLSRYWFIFNSPCTHRSVQGDGVVGEQPEIAPNASYTYISHCDLNAEFGHMSGSYTFQNLITETEFQALIPRFILQYPLTFN